MNTPIKPNPPPQAWRPFWTLLIKEILRFWSVGIQTLAAPLMNASLYLLVFGVSMGHKINFEQGYSYLQFIVPGLIVMGVANNSFANTSSSIFMSRFLGYIVDYLLAPLSTASFLCAHLMAAMVRGFIVGFLIWILSMFFTSLPWAHPGLALLTLFLTSLMFASLGVVAALFSKSFDHLSAFTNFLILPLIYVGGLFYPVTELPGFWKDLSLFNPIFYMLASFRHAVLGVGEISLEKSLGLTTLFATLLVSFSTYLVFKGKGLKDPN